MYFLREQLFWSLWLLISVTAALCIMVADYCGCCLLDSLIPSKGFKLRTKPKRYFFIKVFTTSKTFAILTCINTNLRCITIVDYCESNKQMGWVCV